MADIAEHRERKKSCAGQARTTREERARVKGLQTRVFHSVGTLSRSSLLSTLELIPARVTKSREWELQKFKAVGVREMNEF